MAGTTGSANCRRIAQAKPRKRARLQIDGLGYGVPALLVKLSADCPKQKSVSAHGLCGAHCPDLSTLFLGGTG